MILFVDDEARIMDSYVQYLRRELAIDNYEVVFLSNVDEALKCFEDNVSRIDLLILDIMMPPGLSFSVQKTNGGLKTGLAFYQRVRERSPDLPIIIFTNFSDDDVNTKFKQDSNCRFLQKVDYMLNDFVEEVRRVLAKRSA